MHYFGLFVVFLSVVSVADGFIFGSKPHCPIKKYKGSKHIDGDPLLVHENFYDRLASVENVAKSCKVLVHIKGSYRQLASASESVQPSDADLVIGHGFRFELRQENGAVLCNKICLGKYPLDMPEVKCFMQGMSSHGFIWSRLHPDLISDGTYASNVGGYHILKTDIQTKCQSQKFKRQLLRALRRMEREEIENQFNDE